MGFVKQIAEIADILGLLNLGQNIKQTNELRLLKIILKNQALLMARIDQIDKNNETKGE
ncbi:MAG: hypothetical protein RSB59_04975 [Clostridia bacterium]